MRGVEVYHGVIRNVPTHSIVCYERNKFFLQKFPPRSSSIIFFSHHIYLIYFPLKRLRIDFQLIQSIHSSRLRFTEEIVSGFATNVRLHFLRIGDTRG